MSRFGDQIRAAAARHNLPQRLIDAIVTIESAGEPYAYRPEPTYRYLWDVRLRRPFRICTDAEIASETAPRDFPSLAGHRNQEWWAQQASWGLMQVMGAVARERGLMAPYLPELTDAATNIEIGCAHLSHLADRFLVDHGWDGVIAAYNTGGPGHGPGSAGEAYVRRVRMLWND